MPVNVAILTITFLSSEEAIPSTSYQTVSFRYNAEQVDDTSTTVNATINDIFLPPSTTDQLSDFDYNYFSEHAPFTTAPDSSNSTNYNKLDSTLSIHQKYRAIVKRTIPIKS